MSRRGQGSISALARWRAFGEARASERFQHENSAEYRAREICDEARTKLQDVEQSRAALLGVDDIDLPRLQVAAQIERASAEQVRARQYELAAAQRLRDAAQAAYVAARADTRVVDARGARLDSAEADRREKALFDWMADLHAQSRRTIR